MTCTLPGILWFNCISIAVQCIPTSVVQWVAAAKNKMYVSFTIPMATDQTAYVLLVRFILMYYFHWVQAVLVTLAREVELLSTSLKKAGWSVPDVTETMKMGLSAVW